MNNCYDLSDSEPSECPSCFSSMTETNSATSTWLQCDECEYQTRKAKLSLRKSKMQTFIDNNITVK